MFWQSEEVKAVDGVQVSIGRDAEGRWYLGISGIGTGKSGPVQTAYFTDSLFLDFAEVVQRSLRRRIEES